MTTLHTSLAACLVALGTAAVALEQDERVQLADGLYARGMYALAVQEYTSLLAANPTGLVDRIVFRRGECYRQLGDRLNADRDYRRVFTEFTASAFRHRAGYWRAELFRAAGQDEEAASLYRVVLDAKPPADIAAVCLYFLGDTLDRRGSGAAARQAWEDLLAHHAGSEFASYAQLRLGAYYAGAKKDQAKALAFYAQAAEKPANDRIAAEALFQTAEIHFAAKTYDRAAEAYGRLIQRFASDERAAPARVKAGWAAYYAGRYADALRYVAATNAAATTTDVPETLYLRANCERQLARHEAASASYLRLTAAFPKSEYVAAAQYELALVYYKAGRFDEAVACALKVPEASPLLKDVYWLLAESYSAMKREDDAVQYYRLILRAFPDSSLAGDAAYRLGHHLQSRGEFLEASRCFTKAAAAAPQGDLAPQALFASAFCLDKAGKRDEAARDWAALVERYPRHRLVEEALYQKGLSEVRLERTADAVETFRRLVEQNPKGRFAADAHYWRGMLLRQTGRREDAETELRQALACAPRREIRREAEFGLAIVLQDLGRTDEAVTLLSPLVRTAVRQKITPELACWLGGQQLARGQFTNAADTAELLLAPEAGAVWTQAGWILKGRAALALGRPDAAAAAFEQALALKIDGPDVADAALQLGELALAAGRHPAAQRYFERAAAMAASDGQLATRGRAYAGLGRTAAATNNPAGAARYFMSVAVLFDDDTLVPESLWRAAAAFRAAGQQDAATQAMQELKQRYPGSRYATGGASTNAPR